MSTKPPTGRQDSERTDYGSAAPPPAAVPARRCRATTQSGDPCRMTPLTNDDACWNHSQKIDPQLRADVQRLGGLAVHAQSVIADTDPDPDLGSAESIGVYLEATAGLLLRGRISPTMAAALSNIAATAIRARELLLADQVAELERRVLAAKVAKGVLDVKGVKA